MAIPTYRSQTIPVISLPPNWKVRPRWGQQYSTTITEALTTKEERQARLPRPLYRLGYTTNSLTAAETQYLRRVIETADDLPVACPLWPMACQLTAAAAGGANSVATDDTTDCLFEVFYEFALLWQSYSRWEVVQLSAVTESGATLSAVLGQSYSEDSLLLPLAYGHVPRGPISQLTDEHGAWECRFEERFHRLHDQSVPESGALPEVSMAIAMEEVGA